jgi:hypothetical protein
VVIVALKDKLLDELHDKLKAQYPQLEFRAVGVDLSGTTWTLAHHHHRTDMSRMALLACICLTCPPLSISLSLSLFPINRAGSSGDYMQTIAEATDDIDVSLLFNNAGYIIIGVRFASSFSLSLSLLSFVADMVGGWMGA